MKQALLINSSNVWQKLAGKSIYNKIVVLQQMGDIHPFNPTPIVNCETLIVDGCDKNFVYYWVGNEFRGPKKTFPKVKEIFLNSHPCEPNTLFTLDNQKDTITYLEEHW